MNRTIPKSKTAKIFILSVLLISLYSCNHDEKENPPIYTAGLYNNNIKIENIVNIPNDVHFEDHP